MPISKTWILSIIIPTVIIISSLLVFNNTKKFKRIKVRKVRFNKHIKVYKHCSSCKGKHLLSECLNTSQQEKEKILNKLQKVKR